MEFDVTKVYTAVNADELPVGSTVVLAHSMSILRDSIENYIPLNSCELNIVRSDSYAERFISNDTTGGDAYALAYLIALPGENKPEYIVLDNVKNIYKQLKDNDMIPDFINCCNEAGDLDVILEAERQKVIERSLDNVKELYTQLKDGKMLRDFIDYCNEAGDLEYIIEDEKQQAIDDYKSESDIYDLLEEVPDMRVRDFVVDYIKENL